MNLLNRLLYNKLYNEEGGEAPAGGGGEAVATGEAHIDTNGGTFSGRENGNGVELFAGKYKSVEELEKGYKESVSMGTKNTEKMNSMSEKLKGFSGSPEGDYEFDGDNGYTDGVMSAIGEWGKDQGMSQEAYSTLLSKVGEAEAINREEHQTREMGLLGKDAQIRIDNTNDKLKAIFGEDLAAQYQGIGTSAAGVEALEQLVLRFGDNTTNPDGGDFVGETPITQDELGEMMNKKDSAGTPMMQASPEYAKSVYAKIDKYNKQRGIS